jgi:hypothetical protein
MDTKTVAVQFWAAMCYHKMFVAGDLIHARALWNHLGFKGYSINRVRRYGEKQGWWEYVRDNGKFRVLKTMDKAPMRTLLAHKRAG